MLHRIENKQLKAEIDTNGAELRSLIDKVSGQEYIWPMNPAVWASSSPLLFPAVGTVKEACVLHQGESYALPKHGIIRHNEGLQFKQMSEHHLIASLASTKASKALYPFDFQFAVHYELLERKLIIRFEIENSSAERLFFNLGGHTAYYCPLKQAKLSDYKLHFPGKTKLVSETIDKSSMLLGYQQREFMLQHETLALSESLFNEDALIFANIGLDEVFLTGPEGFTGLRLKFKGFPYLALWAKPGADYLCIEPWLGLPDRVDAPLEISQKKNYRGLAPGNKMEYSIETCIDPN